MLNIIMHEEEAEVIRVLLKREQRNMRRALREQSRIKDEDELIDIVRYVDMLGDVFDCIATAEDAEAFIPCELVDADDLAAFIAKELADAPFYIPEEDGYIKAGYYLAGLLLEEFDVLEKPDEDEE